MRKLMAGCLFYCVPCIVVRLRLPGRLVEVGMLIDTTDEMFPTFWRIFLFHPEDGGRTIR
jgi:hypothetical protein